MNIYDRYLMSPIVNPHIVPGGITLKEKNFRTQRRQSNSKSKSVFSSTNNHQDEQQSFYMGDEIFRRTGTYTRSPFQFNAQRVPIEMMTEYVKHQEARDNIQSRSNLESRSVITHR